ncbi:MAG: recombination protein RecR [Phycisphaerales bacterium]|nr:recombination mediator RecR [Phycisphaerae bacterium]NNF43978.1 recombination protein RecR [Phycisphaerales bacterium]NNM25372.1 recombination protein RecR [Phycisphaerales bacterium]
MTPTGANRGGSNPEPVERLIDLLTRLPGIGRRSAERMAFHLLKSAPDLARDLSQAVLDVKEKVRHCRICFNLSDVDPCRLCTASGRDASLVLVVEQPRDVMSLAGTGLYPGVFHVLTGVIDPLSGVQPEDITVRQLLERIDDPARNCRGERVREVILGLNPTLEGDSTALYIAEQLARRDVVVTRLARGLPSGSQLEYANAAVLADAIEGRRRVNRDG